MASRKCTNTYIPKYFMAVRKFINMFVLLEVLSMVRSNGINPSSILQQFNWSHQLIIVVFVLFWRFSLRFGSDPDQVVRMAGDSFCRT